MPGANVRRRGTVSPERLPAKSKRNDNGPPETPAGRFVLMNQTKAAEGFVRVSIQSHHHRPAGRSSVSPRAEAIVPSSSPMMLDGSRACFGWSVTPPPIGVTSLLPR